MLIVVPKMVTFSSNIPIFYRKYLHFEPFERENRENFVIEIVKNYFCL